MPYRLSPTTLLRSEPGGALLFQQERAETAYLDMEGLVELCRLCDPRSRQEQNVFFTSYLLQHGLLLPGEDEGSLESVEACLEEARRIEAPMRSLAVPETIHFSVTGCCDQACAGCFYSARQGSEVEPGHVPWELFQRVVQEAGQHKVFQMALGGGEPLLHPQIVEMVRLLRTSRVVPNLTTSGNRLDRDLAQVLREAGLGQIQISLNGASHQVNSATRPNFRRALAAMRACREVGLRFGINFLLIRSSVQELESVVRLGSDLGAATVNILRPKPPTVEGDWLWRESLDGSGYQKVKRMLPRLSQLAGGTKLTLDASLTFLLTDTSPQALYRNGVWGCSAGRRFCTVIQDGRVLPCSHVRQSDVGDGDFMHAWRESGVFARFRAQEDEICGPCQTCDYVEVCKGCRAVTMVFERDFAAGDPHCPRGVSAPLEGAGHTSSSFWSQPGVDPV